MTQIILIKYAMSATYVCRALVAMSVLLIDNYDSFTYNLYQYLSELGARVHVVRNDAMTVDACLGLKPTHVVISPGASSVYCTLEQNADPRSILLYCDERRTWSSARGRGFCGTHQGARWYWQFSYTCPEVLSPTTCWCTRIGTVPILGVCLGHQTIFDMYGGKVDVGPEIVHGKVSKVTHDGKGCVLFVPQRSINDSLHCPPSIVYVGT